MRVTKISSESCRMDGMVETPFLRSDRQRYCRMAQMNFSPDRKPGPDLRMMAYSSCSESSLERSSIESSDGSGSGSGFIDSLHSERKTRNASFCAIEVAAGLSRRAKTTSSIWVSVALAVFWMVAFLETRRRDGSVYCLHNLQLHVLVLLVLARADGLLQEARRARQSGEGGVSEARRAGCRRLGGGVRTMTTSIISFGAPSPCIDFPRTYP
eukprot:scaffold13315_cov115-Isochrysis_galbana.AAC.5